MQANYYYTQIQQIEAGIKFYTALIPFYLYTNVLYYTFNETNVELVLYLQA